MTRHTFTIFAALLVLVLAACTDPAAEATPNPTRSEPSSATSDTRRAIEGPPSCARYDARLVLCPSLALAQQWAQDHVVAEEPLTAPGLTPADPLRREEGLVLYERLLREVAPETRVHLELWAYTPPLADAEIAWFEAHPELWERAVALRKARAGSKRLGALRATVSALAGQPEALRRVLFRSDVFYLDDRASAAWAGRNLSMSDLFEEPELELVRAGRRYRLVRDKRGEYLHADPEMEGYRARLLVLDRVAPVGELAPVASFGLQSLRDRYALEHVSPLRAMPWGHVVEVASLDGVSFTGALVRTEREAATLALVASPEVWEAGAEERALHQRGIEGLKEATHAMVRENLFFDEPANEEGQQDGIMRLAFAKAFRRGEVEYEVNDKTYPIFDRQGRPRPPQVCIDFITDAVERSTGRWWPRAEAEERRAREGRINIRDYMPYRQVSRLVEMAELHPRAVSRRSFSKGESPAFEKAASFHAALKKHRDDWREGDVVVIYGLRDDGRNHWHSFYVYETDPVFGIPTVLVDQAGHARLRPWNVIMRAAPKRSVHHRVRWNPRWLEQPEGVDRAEDVEREAKARIEAMMQG